MADFQKTKKLIFVVIAMLIFTDIPTFAEEVVSTDKENISSYFPQLLEKSLITPISWESFLSDVETWEPELKTHLQLLLEDPSSLAEYLGTSSSAGDDNSIPVRLCFSHPSEEAHMSYVISKHMISSAPEQTYSVWEKDNDSTDSELNYLFSSRLHHYSHHEIDVEKYTDATNNFNITIYFPALSKARDVSKNNEVSRPILWRGYLRENPEGSSTHTRPTRLVPLLCLKLNF